MIITPVEHDASNETPSPSELLIKEARQRTRRRHAKVGAITFSAIVIVVALVVIGVDTINRGASAGHGPGNTVAARLPSDNFTNLAGANTIATAGNHIWVSSILTNSVAEFNASNGALVRVIDAKTYRIDSPGRMVVNNGNLWVTNDTNPSVTEINADTGKLVRVVTAEPGGFGYITGIAASGSDIWISGRAGRAGAIFEINANTGALVRVIKAKVDGFNIPDFSVPIVFTANSAHVWVLNSDGGTITELNAKTGSLIRVINAHAGRSSARSFSGPTSLAVYGSHLWVTDQRSADHGSSVVGSVAEFNVNTGALIRIVNAKADKLVYPHSVAVSDNRVWVLSADASPLTLSITELNASNGTLVRVINGKGDGLNDPVSVVINESRLLVLNIYSGQQGSVTEINASNGALLRTIK